MLVEAGVVVFEFIRNFFCFYCYS